MSRLPSHKCEILLKGFMDIQWRALKVLGRLWKVPIFYELFMVEGNALETLSMPAEERLLLVKIPLFIIFVIALVGIWTNDQLNANYVLETLGCCICLRCNTSVTYKKFIFIRVSYTLRTWKPSSEHLLHIFMSCYVCAFMCCWVIVCGGNKINCLN